MTRVLSKIAIKSERLDTQMYLAANSADHAFKRWYADMATELEALAEAFTQISWDYSIGSLVILNEKRLEQDNQEFLGKVGDFLHRIEEIIAAKGDQYAKICSKFGKEQELDQDVGNLLREEGEAYMIQLDYALRLVNRFCSLRIKQAKKLRVYSTCPLFQRLEELFTINRHQMLFELGNKARG
jgi:hypothetical protein